MSGLSLDELLFSWRSVIGQAPKGWARDFALSIQKARKRPNWQPSPKQLALMRRMVADLYAFPAQGDAEVELIEGE
jgi:hypothetical protein